MISMLRSTASAVNCVESVFQSDRITIYSVSQVWWPDQISTVRSLPEPHGDNIRIRRSARTRVKSSSCCDNRFSKQLLSRGVADRDHSRIFQSSFHRDGVKLISDIVGVSDGVKAVLPQNLAGEHGGNWKYSSTRLAESSQKRIILKFSCNHGLNALRLEPEIQTPADGGVFAGQQHGNLMQRMREFLLQISR